MVPASGGLSRRIRPPSASTRSLRPSRPVPRAKVGAAASVVADLHPQHVGAARPRMVSTWTWTVEACGVLGGVGQRLGHHVVGGDLDLFGQSPLDRDVQLDGDGAAAGECVQRRSQPALGEDRRVDAAGKLAQLVQRAGRLGRPASPAGPPARRTRAVAPPAPRAARRASETSRCWAPSCRSRSMRRRAWSAAATIRAREAVSSAYSWALSRETASWPAMSLTASSRSAVNAPRSSRFSSSSTARRRAAAEDGHGEQRAAVEVGEVRVAGEPVVTRWRRPRPAVHRSAGRSAAPTSAPRVRGRCR